MYILHIICFSASELRAWLLYYSFPVLKGVLPSEHYCHFALLSTSIYLLLQQTVTQDALILEDRQLEQFYCQIEDYYGKVYNNLNHNIANYTGIPYACKNPCC